MIIEVSIKLRILHLVLENTKRKIPIYAALSKSMYNYLSYLTIYLT